MASLIENLISVIEEENSVYEQMIPLAEKKTQIIVANDLQALESITAQEQLLIDRVSALERQRQEVIVNIGTVLNKKPEELTFRALIDILKGQQREQEVLRDLHDRLSKTIRRLNGLNERNKSLIKQSLEMIDFNINFIRSTWTSPGTAQYGRKAEVDLQNSRTGMFDAKQ